MKEGISKEQLIESLLLIVSVIIVGIIGLGFLPYLLLFPAIFTIFSIRNGSLLATFTIIVSAIALGLLLGLGLGIFLLAICLPMTLLYNYLIVKRRKSSEIILSLAILTFVFLLIMMKLMDLNGINLIGLLEENFNEAMTKQLDIYEGMGLTSLELSEKVSILENSYKYVLLIIPSLLFIFSMIVSYVNYVIIVIGLEKMALRLAQRPSLSKFRLPNNFIISTALIIIASIFTRGLESAYLDTIFINIQVLIGFAFSIQGLSVIEHLLVKRKVKLWIRTISYAVFFFLPPIITFLPLLGAGDMIFDFKKLRKPKSE